MKISSPKHFITLTAVAFSTSLLLAATASAATAGPTKADCERIFGLKLKDAMKEDPADIHQCSRTRAYDPPVEWRATSPTRGPGASGGIASEGSSGQFYGVVMAPDAPPGANAGPGSGGAKPSVSAAAQAFGDSFPPWDGISCKSITSALGVTSSVCTGNNSKSDGDGNKPATGGGGGAGAFCPQASDTTGTYGAKQPLTGGAPSLVCGGAVPLSSYRLTLNRNATGLASTEYGAYYIWFYRLSTDSDGKPIFKSSPSKPVSLPTYLCKKDLNGRMKKSVTLTAPIAQMITYNSSINSLTIRLTPPKPNISTGKPGTGPTDPVTGEPITEPTELPDGETVEPAPEKYLIIPLIGGQPQVPKNCADEVNYYKPADAMQADLSIESAVNTGCEGDTSQCAGASPAPSPTASCDVATIYTSGTTVTAGGDVDCGKQVLMAVLDRPNLIYPPGSTPIMVPIEGRTGALAQSVDGSLIYAQYETIFRFGATAPPFTFPTGGALAMNNNTTFQMNGPATINPAGGSVTLVNGGSILDAQGGLIQSLPPNSTYSPSGAIRPFTVQIERDMELPTGFLVPTQPNPYVRLPLATK